MINTFPIPGKYDNYDKYYSISKTISFLEGDNLKTGLERLQGVAVFILLDNGFKLDEIEAIKPSDYNGQIIELENVVGSVEPVKTLWDFIKETNKEKATLIDRDIVKRIRDFKFK